VAPQDDALDPELTAAENLFFHACYSGVPRVEACALVPRWLELMGLDGRGNTAVQSLSSGLRRRLVLARALMNEPRVVLLDEPTRGLDGESRAQYLEILQGMKRQGATLLLATHEMEEAATLCDQAARLERGSVCEVGPVHEVLRAADSLARLPEVRGAGAC
jgi:lipooligosaccharide transport system ATP-binding protein